MGHMKTQLARNVDIMAINAAGTTMLRVLILPAFFSSS